MYIYIYVYILREHLPLVLPAGHRAATVAVPEGRLGGSRGHVHRPVCVYIYIYREREIDR